MARTSNQVKDVGEADIWVMDKQVRYMEEVRPMKDGDLYKVRGVEGVEWAVPFYKGIAIMKPREGYLRQVIIVGVDDASLTGRPPAMDIGNWEDIKKPNAIIMDSTGWRLMFPDKPLEMGAEFEINDMRVKVEGFADASAPFLTFPIVYMKYSEVKRVVPPTRNMMSFILVKSDGTIPAEHLTQRIADKTGLQAVTKQDFLWQNITYYLENTGIAINFGITVMLGFVIGAVVCGQTFYLFVVENLKQFGALKAIGVTNGQALKMVLLQAIVVAILGYGIGIGLAALFFESMKDVPAFKGFVMLWQVAAGTFVAIVMIIFLSILASMRKVFVLDPAIVFRG
jgi:putative ABC transport system permease protein